MAYLAYYQNEMMKALLNHRQDSVEIKVVEALLNAFQKSQEENELIVVDKLIEQIVEHGLASLSVSQCQHICEILEKYIEVFEDNDDYYNEIQPILQKQSK